MRTAGEDDDAFQTSRDSSTAVVVCALLAI
jgi:hypothetical protein